MFAGNNQSNIPDDVYFSPYDEAMRWRNLFPDVPRRLDCGFPESIERQSEILKENTWKDHEEAPDGIVLPGSSASLPGIYDG